MDNLLSKIIRCGIILILIVAPLYYSSYTQNSFGAPKRIFFEITMAALLMLFAAQIVLSPDRFLSRSAPLDLLVIAWLVWIAITSILSLDRPESMREFIYSTCLAGFYFLITRNVVTRGQIILMIGVIAALGLLEALYGIAEIFGVKLLYETNIRNSIPASESTLWRWNILGTFGNANQLASYLALSAPLALGLAALWRGWRRNLILLGLAFIVISLILTGARGSMLAGAVGLAIPLIWSYFQGARIGAKRALAAAVLFAMLLTLTFVFKPNIGRDIVGRFKSAASLKPTGSIQFRLLTWKVSMLMIEHRPITGSGPGTFKLLFLPTLAEYLKGGDPLSCWWFMQKMNEPHNEYIQAAVETGLPGLALFIAIVASVISAARGKLAKMKPPDLFFTVTLAAGFIAALADAFASITFQVVPTYIAFWALAALLVSRKGPEKPLPAGKPAQHHRIWSRLAAVYLVCFSFAAFISAVKDLECELAFKQGTLLTGARRFPEALRSFGRALRIRPASGQLKFYYGSTLIQLRRYPEGIAVLKDSEKNFQDIYLHKNMGVAYERLGRPERAAEEYAKWRAMGIGSQEANNLIAMIRYRQGNKAEAEKLFRETLRVSPNDWTAYSTLGAILLDSGRYREAVDALNPARFPNNPSAYNLYGVALLRAGRLDEAERNFLHAVSLDPNFIKARNNLAALYSMQGKREEAFKEWDEVLKRDPGNAIASKNVKALEESKGKAIQPLTD